MIPSNITSHTSFGRRITKMTSKALRTTFAERYIATKNEAWLRYVLRTLFLPPPPLCLASPDAPVEASPAVGFPAPAGVATDFVPGAAVVAPAELDGGGDLLSAFRFLFVAVLVFFPPLVSLESAFPLSSPLALDELAVDAAFAFPEPPAAVFVLVLRAPFPRAADVLVTGEFVAVGLTMPSIASSSIIRPAPATLASFVRFACKFPSF